jgi:hypothetical protein
MQSWKMLESAHLPPFEFYFTGTCLRHFSQLNLALSLPRIQTMKTKGETKAARTSINSSGLEPPQLMRWSLILFHYRSN